MADSTPHSTTLQPPHGLRTDSCLRREQSDRPQPLLAEPEQLITGSDSRPDAAEPLPEPGAGKATFGAGDPWSSDMSAGVPALTSDKRCAMGSGGQGGGYRRN
uniref:Uncharacterized protein n=1 Tax=Ditylenchus dipsaci TaxID=166011 RepID=A0A915E9K9_9BILA